MIYFTDSMGRLCFRGRTVERLPRHIPPMLERTLHRSDKRTIQRKRGLASSDEIPNRAEDRAQGPIEG